MYQDFVSHGWVLFNHIIIPTENASNNFNEENTHQPFINNCVTMAFVQSFLKLYKVTFYVSSLGVQLGIGWLLKAATVL